MKQVTPPLVQKGIFLIFTILVHFHEFCEFFAKNTQLSLYFLDFLLILTNKTLGENSPEIDITMGTFRENRK